MARDVMLTTSDNPFNPFDDFDNWNRFDEDRGYFTCSYLARIAITPASFTEQEQADEIESAIDEIIAINPLGIYKKVVQEYEESIASF